MLAVAECYAHGSDSGSISVQAMVGFCSLCVCTMWCVGVQAGVGMTAICSEQCVVRRTSRVRWQPSTAHYEKRVGAVVNVDQRREQPTIQQNSAASNTHSSRLNTAQREQRQPPARNTLHNAAYSRDTTITTDCCDRLLLQPYISSFSYSDTEHLPHHHDGVLSPAVAAGHLTHLLFSRTQQPPYFSERRRAHSTLPQRPHLNLTPPTCTPPSSHTSVLFVHRL